MTTRTIDQIESATNEKVGDFKIKNVLPTRNLKQVDPFLLIHHMQPFKLEAGSQTRLPPHPQPSTPTERTRPSRWSSPCPILRCQTKES